MPLGSLCRFFCGEPASRPPYIDMSTRQDAWRLANVPMTLFFVVAATAQLNSYDWWLWGPMYAIPSLLCASIVLCPKSVDHPLWRMLCATIIVCGLPYLLYLFWIVREVASFGYLQNPLDFHEGRECAGLAVAVVWSVICRLTVRNSDSILIHIRLLTLMAILLCCVPVFAWSMCFYAPGQRMLPYCKRMLATGDRDL